MPHPEPNPNPFSPRTNSERELVRIWEQVFQRAPIGIQENFFDVGGTSVLAARIFAMIEETFHKRMPVSCILSAPTIQQLAASLDPSNSTDPKAFVVPIHAGGEKPALFCIGEGLLWQHISEYIGPDQPLYSVELDPETIEQTKGPNAMERLSRHIVSALCEKQRQGPFYLCGFCVDGVFAYEVARQLSMYGHEVGLVVLVESRNPSPCFRVRAINGLRRNAIRLAFQADQLSQVVRKGAVPEYLRARGDELARFALRVLMRVSPGSLPRVRQTGRLDSREFISHEMSSSKLKPSACPTAIFRCEIWPTYSAGDPYFGWRELLKGRSETHEIPGEHTKLFVEPNVRVLAETLKACLRNARQAKSPDFGMITDADQRLYLRHSRT
jgi:thioesterase domain-containing protein